MLEADRLVIYAASEREMNQLIEAEQDAELREAYREMLQGSLAHPDDWGWYATWLIVRKDGANIGNLSFKGSPEEGIVEIGYGIGEEYRGYGYATEALETMLEWAFDQPASPAWRRRSRLRTRPPGGSWRNAGSRPRGSWAKKGRGSLRN